MLGERVTLRIGQIGTKIEIGDAMLSRRKRHVQCGCSDATCHPAILASSHHLFPLIHILHTATSQLAHSDHQQLWPRLYPLAVTGACRTANQSLLARSICSFIRPQPSPYHFAAPTQTHRRPDLDILQR